MDLATILSVARRWWVVLLVAAAVPAFVGNTVVGDRDPVFETDGAVLVGPINADNDTLRASGQLAQTYAELATRTDVRDRSVASVAPLLAPSRVSVTATANEVTRILSIRVRAPDAGVAKGVNAAITRELVALGDAPVPVSPDDIRHGEPVPAPRARPEGRMTVVKAAALPAGPVAPQSSLAAVFFGLAGLLAAAAPILLLEYRRQPVRDVEALALPGVTVLGVLGSWRPRARRLPNRLVVDARPNSATAESFRIAATDLDAMIRHAGMRSLLVTGSGLDDGSGDVVANLAGALAQAGLAVTVVDQEAYVAEVSRLAGDPLDAVTFRLRGGDSLTVVPCADFARDGIDDARAWLRGELETADVVLVHAAPPRGSSTTLLWAAVADAAIVVARRELSRRDEVADAVERLRRVGAEVVGVLFDTRWPPRLRGLRARFARRRPDHRHVVAPRRRPPVRGLDGDPDVPRLRSLGRP